MQALLKRFTSQTSAAHFTSNYCTTEAGEAIKSAGLQFNVCREACMLTSGMCVYLNLYSKTVLF